MDSWQAVLVAPNRRWRQKLRNHLPHQDRPEALSCGADYVNTVVQTFVVALSHSQWEWSLGRPPPSTDVWDKTRLLAEVELRSWTAWRRTVKLLDCLCVQWRLALVSRISWTQSVRPCLLHTKRERQRSDPEHQPLWTHRQAASMKKSTIGWREVFLPRCIKAFAPYTRVSSRRTTASSCWQAMDCTWRRTRRRLCDDCWRGKMWRA